MNGIKYYRLKRGMTQRELCQQTGVSLWTLGRMEHMGRESGVDGLLPEHYLRLRAVLGVPVDELLREDLPEVEDDVHVRNMRPSGSDCADNCLAVYRQVHRLTLRELAGILRVSHESVRLASRGSQAPEAYIARLAACEGISADAFCEKYRKGA